MEQPKQIRIGKIVGCHGVRGDIKVHPASNDAKWTETLHELTMKNPKTGQIKQISIRTARHQGPLVILHLAGYNNRNLVEPLIGFDLYADMDDLPKPAKDEYWVDDLIGLSVVDTETGRIRGKVKDLLSSCGSDFLEIQLEESTQSVVIPFIDKFFPQVNLKDHTISIDLLSDFLEMGNKPVRADQLPQ